jgi:GT2 family glycosyltransferase
MTDAVKGSASGQDEDPLLGLPFDQYERYALTKRFADLVWPAEHPPVRVLDVGGNSSPLKHLLPMQAVLLADLEPPGTLRGLPLLHDGYVQSDGSRLPFADGTFDLVASHDTLEHVPQAARFNFLSELLRVSRRFVIVNGPVYHPQTVRAERLLARFVGERSTDEGRFIREHLQLGLPTRETIEGVFADHGADFVGVSNGRLAEWLGMHLARQLTSLLPSDRLGEGLDRAFNRVLAPNDLGGLCYREAYLVAVRPEDAPLLSTIRERMAPRTQASAREPEILAEALTILEDYVESMPEDAMGRDRDRAGLERQLADLESQFDRVTQSAGFRFVERGYRWVDRVAPWGTRRRSLVLAPARAMRMVAAKGWGGLFAHLPRVWEWGPRLWRVAVPPVERLTPEERYDLWLRLHIPSGKQARAMRREARRFSYRPGISVVLEVDDPSRPSLREAVDSVRRQLYGNWQLCLAYPGPADSAYDGIGLHPSEARRVRVVSVESGRGARARNAGLSLATGEFVAFMEQDHQLKPNALLEIVRFLNGRRDVDYLYTDEDRRARDQGLGEPFFKPDWSPDLLLSTNYVGDLSVYRRDVLRQVKGLREGLDGAEGHDLALRVTEATDRIGHITLPLCTVGARTDDAHEERATRSAKRALADALERRGYDGEAVDGASPGYYRVRYGIAGEPLVSIIIPTRDKVELLRQCIDSIQRRSTYRNFELIVVDNDSREPATLRYLDSLSTQVLRYPREFNFSKIVNFAAGEASGEMLLFLNNDTEVISSEWIEAMLEHAQRPDVAAVGARLLFPDGSPQHEGIIVGPGRGLAENAVRGGYFGLDRCIHNASAVTAACMMTRREVFWELGGFEEQLQVAYNDVDFCLRAREKGYVVVYTPYATLYHDEGSTRARLGPAQPEADAELFRKRWAGYRDPYYNPNLDLDNLYALRLEV